MFGVDSCNFQKTEQGGLEICKVSLGITTGAVSLNDEVMECSEWGNNSAGMMEFWNIGIVEKTIPLYPNIPLFHYSSVPVFS